MKNKVIILTGPTGVGKTETSISIAKALNTEIISCDSMQIYKGMDIGTAKITKNESDGIIHHNIDIIDPNDDFTVSDYQSLTMPLVEKLNKEGKIPLIVGGTGFFIDSIIYDLDFTKSEPDYEYRDSLEKIAKESGLDALYDMLLEIDPAQNELIDKNNKQRVIRALEIYNSTGIKPSEQRDNLRKYNDNVDFLYIVLNRDRPNLYDRINKRVEVMVGDGLINEVESLIANGANPNSTAFKAIGYKEVIEYLNGVIDKDNMINLIQQNSRRYAKRQLTWFRREKSSIWFNLDEYSSFDILFSEIMDIINKFRGEDK